MEDSSPEEGKLEVLKQFLFKDKTRIASVIVTLLIFIYTFAHFADSKLKVDVVLLIFASLYLTAL